MKVITVTSGRLKQSKLIVFFSAIAVIVCFALLSIKAASAQGATDSAKKLNITFPVAELGNCGNVEECREYCSDEANREACVSFARKKGFYKEPNKGTAQSRAMLEKAKAELGCSSEESCKAFCSEEANREKCQAFAQKYGLKPKTENKPNFTKVKEALGCDSVQTCKAMCALEENREKCSAFARANGLKGGLKEASEGGKFAGEPRGPKEGTRSGEKFMPNSEKAFEHANENARFCREHPEKCKNASGSGILERQTEQEKRKSQLNREIEKKEFETRKLKEEHERENRSNKGPGSVNSGPGSLESENGDDSKDDDSDIQGVSASPSFISQLIRFFFE